MKDAKLAAEAEPLSASYYSQAVELAARLDSEDAVVYSVALGDLRDLIKRSAALISIAKNTCCDGCGEAG